MLTRRLWLLGGPLIAGLAAATVASAATGPSERSSLVTVRPDTDVARRAHAARMEDRKDGAAPFVTMQACEVPGHDSSAGHFNAMRSRANRGVLGGSYGEIFFAGGAGTRATTTGAASSTTSAAASDSSGAGSADSAASGASGTTASGATASASAGGTATTTDASPTSSAAASGASPNAAAGDHPASAASGAGGAGTAPNGLAIGVGKQAAVNPEPGTMMLLGTGLCGLLFARRRNRDK